MIQLSACWCFILTRDVAQSRSHILYLLRHVSLINILFYMIRSLPPLPVLVEHRNSVFWLVYSKDFFQLPAYRLGFIIYCYFLPEYLLKRKSYPPIENCFIGVYLKTPVSAILGHQRNTGSNHKLSLVPIDCLAAIVVSAWSFDFTQSFLSYRMNKVVLNGHFSWYFYNYVGVPQGAILFF